MTESPRLASPPSSNHTDGEFELLRAGLAGAGFTQAGVLRTLGVPALPDAYEAGFHESVKLDLDSPTALLTALFLLGRTIPNDTLRQHVGDAFVQTAREHGLLRPSVRAGHTLSLVTIHPVAGTSHNAEARPETVWLVSDRAVPAPDEGIALFTDMVYPTVTPSAAQFLRFLPRGRRGRILEPCAGCGPAAVAAGRLASEVVATDIDSRAVAFASYNGRLNGYSNFTAVEGSFYANAEGEFDLIACHPPYVPTEERAEVFYGGGIDGTDLLRQLVAEAPRKLNPGGIFFAVAMIPESDTVPVEEGVRKWLGASQHEMDVFFFPLESRSLVQVAYEAAAKLGRGMDAVSRYRRTLLGMGHARFHYGALVLRRHAGDEPPLNVRRRPGEDADGRHLIWLVDWETAWKSTERAEAFWEADLRASSELEIVVKHRASKEGLEPVQFMAMARRPFQMESRLQGWMTMLFGLVNQAGSPRALYQIAREQGLIHPETPVPEFRKLLSTFVSGGFLESAISPLPAEEG